MGGDTAAVLPGLKLVDSLFFLIPMWTMYMFRSYHLISQAGWNRCNLLYSTGAGCRSSSDWPGNGVTCFTSKLAWL